MEEINKRFVLFRRLYFLVSVPLIFAAPYYMPPVLYFCFPQYGLKMGAAKGDVAVINAALARGASINAHDGFAGRDALMTAALHGHTKAAAFLVAQGAEVEAKDDVGKTARQLAIDAKHFDTAAVLNSR